MKKEAFQSESKYKGHAYQARDAEFLSLNDQFKNHQQLYTGMLKSINGNTEIDAEKEKESVKEHLFKVEQSYFNHPTREQQVKRGDYISQFLYESSFPNEMETFPEYFADKQHKLNQVHLTPQQLSVFIKKHIAKQSDKLQVMLWNIREDLARNLQHGINNDSTTNAANLHNNPLLRAQFFIEKVLQKHDALLTQLKQIKVDENVSDYNKTRTKVDDMVLDDVLFDQIDQSQKTPENEYDLIYFINEGDYKSLIDDKINTSYNISALAKLTRVLLVTRDLQKIKGAIEYLPQTIHFKQISDSSGFLKSFFSQASMFQTHIQLLHSFDQKTSYLSNRMGKQLTQDAYGQDKGNKGKSDQEREQQEAHGGIGNNRSKYNRINFQSLDNQLFDSDEDEGTLESDKQIQFKDYLFRFMLPFQMDQIMAKLDTLCNMMGINLEIDIGNAALYLYHLEVFFTQEFEAQALQIDGQKIKEKVILDNRQGGDPASATNNQYQDAKATETGKLETTQVEAIKSQINIGIGNEYIVHNDQTQHTKNQQQNRTQLMIKQQQEQTIAQINQNSSNVDIQMFLDDFKNRHGAKINGLSQNKQQLSMSMPQNAMQNSMNQQTSSTGTYQQVGQSDIKQTLQCTKTYRPSSWISNLKLLPLACPQDSFFKLQEIYLYDQFDISVANWVRVIHTNDMNYMQMWIKRKGKEFLLAHPDKDELPGIFLEYYKAYLKIHVIKTRANSYRIMGYLNAFRSLQKSITLFFNEEIQQSQQTMSSGSSVTAPQFEIGGRVKKTKDKPEFNEQEAEKQIYNLLNNNNFDNTFIKTSPIIVNQGVLGNYSSSEQINLNQTNLQHKIDPSSQLLSYASNKDNNGARPAATSNNNQQSNKNNTAENTAKNELSGQVLLEEHDSISYDPSTQTYSISDAQAADIVYTSSRHDYHQLLQHIIRISSYFQQKEIHFRIQTREKERAAFDLRQKHKNPVKATANPSDSPFVQYEKMHNGNFDMEKFVEEILNYEQQFYLQKLQLAMKYFALVKQVLFKEKKFTLLKTITELCAQRPRFDFFSNEEIDAQQISQRYFAPTHKPTTDIYKFQVTRVYQLEIQKLATMNSFIDSIIRHQKKQEEDMYSLIKQTRSLKIVSYLDAIFKEHCRQLQGRNPKQRLTKKNTYVNNGGALVDRQYGMVDEGYVMESLLAEPSILQTTTTDNEQHQEYQQSIGSGITDQSQNEQHPHQNERSQRNEIAQQHTLQQETEMYIELQDKNIMLMDAMLSLQDITKQQNISGGVSHVQRHHAGSSCFLYLDKVVDVIVAVEQAIKITHRLCTSNITAYANSKQIDYDSISRIANECLFLQQIQYLQLKLSNNICVFADERPFLFLMRDPVLDKFHPYEFFKKEMLKYYTEQQEKKKKEEASMALQQQPVLYCIILAF